VIKNPKQAISGIDPATSVFDCLAFVAFWTAAYFFINVFLQYTAKARQRSGIEASTSKNGLLSWCVKHTSQLTKSAFAICLASSLAALVGLAPKPTQRLLDCAYFLHIFGNMLGGEAMIFILVADMSFLLFDIDSNLASIQSTNLVKGKGIEPGPVQLSAKRFFTTAGDNESKVGGTNSDALVQQVSKMKSLRKKLSTFRGEVLRQGFVYALQSSLFALPYFRNKYTYSALITWSLGSFLGMLTFILLPVKLNRSKTTPRVAPHPQSSRSDAASSQSSAASK
jgi:hypothetical protein